jgi:hypothetical protein
MKAIMSFVVVVQGLVQNLKASTMQDSDSLQRNGKGLAFHMLIFQDATSN